MYYCCVKTYKNDGMQCQNCNNGPIANMGWHFHARPGSAWPCDILACTQPGLFELLIPNLSLARIGWAYGARPSLWAARPMQTSTAHPDSNCVQSVIVVQLLHTLKILPCIKFIILTSTKSTRLQHSYIIAFLIYTITINSQLILYKCL